MPSKKKRKSKCRVDSRLLLLKVLGLLAGTLLRLRSRLGLPLLRVGLPRLQLRLIQINHGCVFFRSWYPFRCLKQESLPPPNFIQTRMTLESGLLGASKLMVCGSVGLAKVAPLLSLFFRRIANHDSTYFDNVSTATVQPVPPRLATLASFRSINHTALWRSVCLRTLAAWHKLLFRE